MPTAAEYREQLKQLLPPGQAFPRDPGTTLHDLLDGMSIELARVDARSFALPVEANPSTTFELLSDWERVTGLPDRCSGALEETIQGRRNAVLAKLSSTGGQSAAYFIGVAAALGYQVTITEFYPFRVGRSRVGDALTNGAWQFAWQINAPETTAVPFRVGLSAVGEALRTWGAGSLECKIRQLAPAHTVPIFAYAGSSLDLLFDSGTYLLKQQTSSFGALITFTRAGAGGRWNAAGVYEMIAPNQPRFDFDPITRAPLGLLMEEARTNIGLQSNSVTTMLNLSRASYIATAQLFIDGIGLLRLLREDTTAANTHFGTPAAVAVAANTTYTMSYFVKAAGRTKMRLDVVSTGSWAPSTPSVTFDLIAGTFTTANGAIGSIKKVSADIYRISMTATTGAAGFSTSAYPVMLDGLGNAAYNGDGVSGVYIGGYQLEAGAFPTSYIATAAAAVTRGMDLALVNDLSAWYNAAAGTFYVDYNPGPIGLGATTNGLYASAAVISNDRIVIRKGTGQGEIRGLTSNSAAVAQADLLGATGVAVGDAVKGAIAVALNDVAFSVNGGAVVKDNLAAMPIPTRLAIGSATTLAGAQSANGTIRRIRYYPRRLTDAELQTITAS